MITLRNVLPIISFPGGSAVQSSIPEQLSSNNLLRTSSFSTFKHEFQLEDACTFITDGIGVSVVGVSGISC